MARFAAFMRQLYRTGRWLAARDSARARPPEHCCYRSLFPSARRSCCHRTSGTGCEAPVCHGGTQGQSMSRPSAKIPRVIDATEVMRPVVAELQRELSLRRLLEEYLAGHQSKHQGLIDAILRCILNGEDPRPVLDLPPRRSGIKP